MGRTRRGEVSARQRGKAISLLAHVIGNEKAALYLRVNAARSILSQKNPESADDDDDPDFDPNFPGGAQSPIVILPPNGREQINQQRAQQRGSNE